MVVPEDALVARQRRREADGVFVHFCAECGRWSPYGYQYTLDRQGRFQPARAAVHNVTMTFARRLAHGETIPQQDSAERAFNKLARTFVSQVEALKRYRSGGEQTIRVEHISVNEGGQAIVGNVTHGGSLENPEPSP